MTTLLCQDLVLSGRIIFADNTSQSTSAEDVALKCANIERNNSTATTTILSDSLIINRDLSIGNIINGNNVRTHGVTLLNDLDENGNPTLQTVSFTGAIRDRIQGLYTLMNAIYPNMIEPGEQRLRLANEFSVFECTPSLLNIYQTDQSQSVSLSANNFVMSDNFIHVVEINNEFIKISNTDGSNTMTANELSIISTNLATSHLGSDYLSFVFDNGNSADYGADSVCYQNSTGRINYGVDTIETTCSLSVKFPASSGCIFQNTGGSASHPLTLNGGYIPNYATNFTIDGHDVNLHLPEYYLLDASSYPDGGWYCWIYNPTGHTPTLRVDGDNYLIGYPFGPLIGEAPGAIKPFGCTKIQLVRAPITGTAYDGQLVFMIFTQM